MARISELHYSNAYAANSGVSEFLEVALAPTDDPADFVVGFYQSNGSLGLEVTLTDPRVISSIDPDTGEVVFVLSADNLPILLTDPDGGGSVNFEAYALTNTDTDPNTVIDFYDIGGGTQNIEAQTGAAAGAVSENLAVVVDPNRTTTTIQFNQPNPDVLVYETVDPGGTGVACFVAGTLIDTPTGPRLIETLRAGDRVWTQDNGDMPVLWAGTTSVIGYGAHAPICLEPGVFGATERVWVSPQHRILVRGWQAELFFGADEILVPAKALINGRSVRQVNRPCVSYFHLLLDGHQILGSHGVLSESYDPAATHELVWSDAAAAELEAMIPTQVGRARAQTARQTQTVREAAVLQPA